MNKYLGIVVFVLFSFFIAQPLVFSAQTPSVAPGSETRASSCQGNAPSLNIKDSLILSVTTACLPGVLEKAEEYKQIKCELVVCKYNALKSGLSPAFCEEQSQYKTCKYVKGEIFAMPGVNVFEQIRSTIAQYLANPEALGLAIAKETTRNLVEGCTGQCISPLVAVGSWSLAISDLAAYAQRMQNIIENGIDGLGARSGENFCEQVPEIEEEVDKILENT